MNAHSLDPVTFEVVWHRLLDITEEMGIKYMRTSGSPVLVGAYDAATAICLPDGQLVAMGPYISTQGHVLRLIIESTLRMRSKAPGIAQGDMFICNDPYLGATHQPDVATIAPVHSKNDLLAWVGSSGHWLDIGGPEPGGFNMNATSVFDEGLRMPPTRIVERGEVREDLVELITNQLRDPLVELDLRGQIVSNNTGRERILEVVDAYGATTVDQVMREAIDYVERRLRKRLLNVPDGVWREVQFLDHDGHRPNLRRIVCTVTKRGSSLQIDFTGTDPQVEGFANSAYGGLRAATLSAVCIMLGYDLTWNDGVARCVDIVAPPRTAMTAEYPTPVSMSTISAIIVALNLVFGALSKMLLTSPGLHEQAMANWCGTSLGVSMIGMNSQGIMTVCPESSHFAAGCGARIDRDGVDTGGIIINTTANIPSVEQTEAEYPVLYLFRRQLEDSGGPGRFRGGMSGGVALIPWDEGGPVETTFAGVGAETPNAFGLAGGLPGATARFLRFTGSTVRAELLAGMAVPADVDAIQGERTVTSLNRSHAPFESDTVEYHNWQGGGGYGDPLDRMPDSVQTDVVRLAVSETVARDIYGVVLGEGGVDEEATRSLRARMIDDRLKRARPAREVLEQQEDWPGLTEWMDESERGGKLAYGDLMMFDFDSDQITCLRCSHVLGSARDDFRHGSLVIDAETSAAGPVRGQDYASDTVRLLLFYCPGCGRQLESEVAAPSGIRAGFRLSNALVSRET